MKAQRFEASSDFSRIREIEASAGSVSFLIHRHGLTEKDAFEVEAAIIDAYPHALNEADGHYNRDRGCIDAHVHCVPRSRPATRRLNRSRTRFAA